MKYSLQLFVYGNFWIGVCALAQGLLTYRLIDTPYSQSLLLVLFLAATFVYNLGVLIDYRAIKQNDYRAMPMQFIAKHATTIALLSMFSLGLIFPIAFLTLKFNTILLLAFTACLALVYSLPVLPSGKGGLRQIPGVKTVLIATVWSLSTVLAPIIESSIDMSMSQLGVLFLKRFILVFVLALVADIRDEETDRKNRLNTIATYLGVRKACVLCYVLLVVELMLIYGYDYGLDKKIFMGLIFFTLLAFAVLRTAFAKKSYLYNLLVVDGLTVAQFLIVELVVLVWV